MIRRSGRCRSVQVIWARALVWGALGVLPGIATEAQARQDNAGDAGDASEAGQEAIRAAEQSQVAAISDMRLRMREMLEERAAEEAAFDRRPLLDRKLAVDSALAPGLLLLELASECRVDPLGILRFDFQTFDVRSAGPEPAVWTAVEESSRAWATLVQGGVRFQYRSQRSSGAGEDFPALVHWHGRVKGDSLSLRAHWFEPFLAQRRLDFPLNPEDLRIDFTAEGASIISAIPSSTASSASFARQRPRFQNQSDLYDPFDTLRVASYLLRWPPSRVPSLLGTSHLVSADTEEGSEYSNRIRSVDWSSATGSLDRITVWQPVVMLRYETPHQLHGQAMVDGEVVGSDSTRPFTELPWFKTGLQATIRLRRPDPALDSLSSALSSTSALRLPDSLTLATHGQLLASTEFLSFHSDAGDAAVDVGEPDWREIGAAVASALARRDLAQAAASSGTSESASGSASASASASATDAFPDDQILGDIDPLVARWRLRANLVRAAVRRDAAAHDHAILLLTSRLAQDGVDARWAVMNTQAWFEELAGPMQMPEVAIELAAPAWLLGVVMLTPDERLGELARLIVSGRWGLALLLARSLDRTTLPPGGAAWLEHLIPVLHRWVVADPSRRPEREGVHPEWDDAIDQAVARIVTKGETP